MSPEDFYHNEWEPDYLNGHLMIHRDDACKFAKAYSDHVLTKKLEEVDNLIKKQEIQSKTLLDVITHEESESIQINKAASCRRFISQFIEDLKTLKEKTI